MSQKFQQVEYNLDDPKQGAIQEIKAFVQKYTKLTSVHAIENNSFNSSLTTVFALSYEENQLLPEVKAKLDVFPKREQLHNCLDVASRIRIESAFEEIMRHGQVVNEFRHKFTDQELKAILEKNKQFLIVVGDFNAQNPTDKITRQSIFGNQNASKAVFIIRNACTKQGWTYMIYCTNEDEYKRSVLFESKISQIGQRNSQSFQEIRGSSIDISQPAQKLLNNIINPIFSNPNQSPVVAAPSIASPLAGNPVHPILHPVPLPSVDPVADAQRQQRKQSPLIQPKVEQNNPDDFRQSKQSQKSNQSINIRQSNSSVPSNNSQPRQQLPYSPKNIEEQQLVYSPKPSLSDDKKILQLDQYPHSGYCQDCQQFKVIDDKSRLCWQCFQKHGKTDYMDIIWYLIFLIIAIFLILLNYHHAKQNKYIIGDDFKLLNWIADRAHQALFEPSSGHNL